MLVAADAHVLQADEIVLRAGLIEPLRHARVVHAVVRALGRDRQNPQVLEVDQLVNRLVLQIAADFVSRPLRRF